MGDREWTYVAASRSRFATTLYVNTALLGLVDPESHREADSKPKSREAAIEALASRMRRSRAKGTSLDYDSSDISTVKTSSEGLNSVTGQVWATANSFIANLRSKVLKKGQERSR